LKNVREAKKRFSEALLELARSRDLYKVFDDFLDFSLLLLRWWDRKPEYFGKLESTYRSQREMEMLNQAYFSMVIVANNRGELFNDPFIDFYEGYLVKKDSGQFFTPQCISDLTARLLDIGSSPAQRIVYDPACGSGSTILGAARENPHLFFFAADRDLVCCKMMVISFMLNRLTGEVAWMDSLTLAHWKSWHLQNVTTEKGDILPYFSETGPGETRLLKKTIESGDEDTQKNNPLPMSELWGEE
jgi:type I restriction-modification system DNA methylase subunit